MMRHFILLGLIFFTSASFAASEYQLVKGHTDLAFSVKHMLISNTRGVFREFKGGFQMDDSTKEIGDLRVEIDSGSIFTNDNDRDTHLKGPDFFDVEKHPKINFKMNKFKYAENRQIKLLGQLSIKGIERQVPVVVTFTGFKTSPFDSKTYGGFTLKATLDRKDFGMTFNKNLDQGGLAIDDKVNIDISGEFAKK